MNEITYKKDLEQDIVNVCSFWKKSQMCIPKEFKMFHFSHTAVDVLNKTEELNSDLYCRLYYCLLKEKMIKIEIYEKCLFCHL